MAGTATGRASGGDEPAPDGIRPCGVLGRGRVQVVQSRQDWAGFRCYLEALDPRYGATGREIYLVLDHGSCHTSKVGRAQLVMPAAWRHPVWPPRYRPHLNRKEREWL